MRGTHMVRPCENCPYRKDAPRKLWHRSEFERLLATEDDDIGSTFACHKHITLSTHERGLCAGWLLNQKARGVPSVMLRILLLSDASVRQAFDRVSAKGLELFKTVEAMCSANGVRRKRGQRKRDDR